MSAPQWKPGDVVTATVNGRPNVRLVAGWSKYDPQLRWCEMSPRWADGDDDECWFMPIQVTDHRPLIAIDPEDREQVQQLRLGVLEAFRATEEAHGGLDDPRLVDLMQAALRSLITPPKPDEPQGLGAVVEDAEGRRYVRVGDDDDWCVADDQAEAKWLSWHNIAAVRVLSEGWSE